MKLLDNTGPAIKEASPCSHKSGFYLWSQYLPYLMSSRFTRGQKCQGNKHTVNAVVKHKMQTLC